VTRRVGTDDAAVEIDKATTTDDDLLAVPTPLP
jgi:hypothetical protein